MPPVIVARRTKRGHGLYEELVTVDAQLETERDPFERALLVQGRADLDEIKARMDANR